MALYQQGDVLIQTVDSIPKSATKLTPDQHKNTLAEGEFTGHAHRANGPVDMFKQDNAPDGDVFMSVPKRITVTHEEHKPVTLPAGMYKVSRVREYDHFAEEARVVRD